MKPSLPLVPLLLAGAIMLLIGVATGFYLKRWAERSDRPGAGAMVTSPVRAGGPRLSA